jgi:sugar phosphate isomerase/epimerase
MANTGHMSVPVIASRRSFLRNSATCLAASLLPADWVPSAFAAGAFKPKISGHLWVYASAYPPNWDASGEMERIFSDFHQAGLDGLEIMEVNLRHDDAVAQLGALSKKFKVPVTGTSYGAAMWDASKHKEILDDVTLVVKRLGQLNGKTFGISVGDARRPKTEAELDAQAALLKEIIKVCNASGVVANLHNHTYEVINDMHDLKRTLARIPDIPLGPDLNWLIRGGIDPVTFIKTYGHQMVYMHIRDQYADGKWTEYVGQGVTNFAAIADALRSVNYRGRAAIELAFEKNYVPKNPLAEDWKRSLDFVRTTFGW